MFWSKKVAPPMPGTWEEFMAKFNLLAKQCDPFIGNAREIHMFVHSDGEVSVTVRINKCEMRGSGANPMAALHDLASKSTAIAHTIYSVVE